MNKMKKDIAIIIPNNPFLTNEKVFPNIGALRVATQLRKDGYSVDVLDFAGRKDEDIIPYANKYKWFGFSSTTPQFPYVMKIFNQLKQTNPKAKTIIGGAHPSALYSLKQKGIEDENLQDLEVFDTIFAGEGEDTSRMFKKGWQKGKLITNVDDMLIPDRDFIDIKSYHYNLNGKDTTCVQTQRGCPHQCAFCCGRDIEMYNRVRFNSPKRVLEELDMLHDKYGYESFMIFNDELNVNMSNLEILCKELSKRKYQFRGFLRSDNVVKYPESIKWLKEAGFVKLCIGIESGSNRILDIINKKSTYEINLKARRLIKEAGIHYEAFMILGHPSETLEDIELTKQWLLKAKPDDFDLNLLTPYPGSIIYDSAVPSTKFKDYKWEWKGLYFNKPRYVKENSFYKGINAQSASNIRTDTLTNKDLIGLRNSIEKEIKNKLNLK
jgi:radical SAM superfamily enzyme YgiQ (UPF0313 family)